MGLLLTAARPSPIAAGGATGALALFFYRLGTAMPAWPRRRNRETRPSSSPRLRSGSGVITALLACLAFLEGGEAIRLQAADVSEATPIVVLYPSEGAADPARRPDRALIRLVDYERLKTWPT